MTRLLSKRDEDEDDGVVADLAAALDRLKRQEPNIVKGSYKINQSTVCKEAGRHRSSIKKEPRFAQLRDDIVAAANSLRRENKSRAIKEEELAQRIERLNQDKNDLEESLEDAGEMILRLYCQLQALEDDRRYILERVSHARKTSKSVDRVFTLMDFDDLVRRRP